jgi:hypothetical protein
VFVHVEVPVAAHAPAAAQPPEPYSVVSNSNNAPEVAFTTTINAPPPLEQIATLCAQLCEPITFSDLAIERANSLVSQHYTRAPKGITSDARCLISPATNNVYENVYSALTSSLLTELADLRPGRAGRWVHQFPLGGAGGVADMVYFTSCEYGGFDIRAVSVVVEAITGTPDTKLKQGGHHVTNTVRLNVSMGDPFVVPLLLLGYSATELTVQLWILSGVHDARQLGRSVRACAFEDSAPYEVAGELLLRLERALGSYADLVTFGDVAERLEPLPHAQDRAWAVTVPGGPRVVRKMLYRVGHWRPLRPAAWHGYVAVLGARFLTRTAAAAGAVDGVFPGAAANTRAQFDDNSVYVEYEYVPGMHHPTRVTHVMALAETLAELHAGARGVGGFSGAVLHGDMRWANCLCRPDGGATLIDFDYAGKPGDRYPNDYRVFLEDTVRHPEALPGAPMAALHDCYSLGGMARMFVPDHAALAPRWEEACATMQGGDLAGALELLRAIDMEQPGASLRPVNPATQASRRWAMGTGLPPQQQPWGAAGGDARGGAGC